ncbi:hypothetical protein K466DRAFT_568379 [Polyporus arcularius HHB13444]|uniref:Uncharacterized protein n=1 Tax=Polyporus arcularius HHB13444 TaxID=1314778 RepID=A0A5C3NYS5_9APHY|nr:hypothetical protein K466DRAFT_568379 [Polyporus arcularius HHB13444]
MPVQSRPIPESPIAHLARCPRCPNGRLTAAIICKGTAHAEDVNKWYQLCLNKELDLDPPACNYFYWFKEHQIPRGPPPPNAPQKRCLFLKAASSTPSVSSVLVHNAAFTLIGLSRVSRVAGSPPTPMQPPADLLSRVAFIGMTPPASQIPPNSFRAKHPPRLPPPPVSRALPAALVLRPRLLALAPGGVSRSPPPPPRHLPPTNSLSVGVRAPSILGHVLGVGRPTRTRHPPRLASHPIEPFPPLAEHNRHLDISLSRVRTAVAQEAQTRTFYLYWWHENDEPAKYIEVIAPNWPYFHPKESEHLVNRFKVDQAFFEAFDRVSNTWVSCWKDSPARRVDVHPPQTVHYRSDGVTRGPGMPGSDTRGLKRGLDVLEHGNGEDRQWSVPPSSAYATPSSSADHWSTPTSMRTADLTESAGPSSRVPSPGTGLFTGGRSPVWPPLLALGNDDPAFDSLLNTPTSTLRSFADPGLDSATAVGADGGQAGSSSDSPVVNRNSQPPEGPHGWPLLYASDMIRGFRKVSELMSSGLALKDAFVAAFPGHQFKGSTYGENHKAYTNAIEVPGEIEQWLELGRAPSGKWALFRKQWKPRK